MDMSLFDEADIKITQAKRDHRNKNTSHNPEDVKDLRKKANRRDKPQQHQFDIEDDE